jgi:hypothetical protein
MSDPPPTPPRPPTPKRGAFPARKGEIDRAQRYVPEGDQPSADVTEERTSVDAGDDDEN